MFTLIITMSVGYSVAVSSVPGFESRELCVKAAQQIIDQTKLALKGRKLGAVQ